MTTGDRVLVYHYRANGQPAVKEGLAVITKQELKEILTNKPDLQTSFKEIPRGASSVEIHQRDLLTPAQIVANEQYPNIDTNVASVGLPLEVMITTVLTGAYSEIVILSKKQS